MDGEFILTRVAPRLLKATLNNDVGSLARRQGALQHGAVSDVIAGAITRTSVLHDLSKTLPVENCLLEQLQSSQLQRTDDEAVYLL